MPPYKSLGGHNRIHNKQNNMIYFPIRIETNHVFHTDKGNVN